MSQQGPSKDVQIPFEKLGLHVGDLLSLETFDPAGRYGVRLLGYYSGHTVMVTLPTMGGKQVMLKQDRLVTVRAANGGTVCAFSTKVKQTNMTPYPYLHLEYPKQMFAVQVRSVERINVALSASVDSLATDRVGSWPRAATINDLSKSGAGVLSEDSLGDSGEDIQISFILSVSDIKRQIRLKATIRNKRILDESHSPNRYSYGLQFGTLSDAAIMIMSGYLYEQFAKGQ